MKLTDSVLTSFIREEFADFKLDYSTTFKYGNFRFQMAGVSGGKKLKIFSHYTPRQLEKELENGYKLVLKHEHQMIIIDLKKIANGTSHT